MLKTHIYGMLMFSISLTLVTYSSLSNGNSQTKLELGMEVKEPNEDALIESIRLITEERMRRSYGKGEVVQRDAHAKTHGLVRAKLKVVDDLPKELRQGIFSETKVYDALIRFSASSQIAQADTVAQPQGMAIKVLGVEGEKLIRPTTTQDFVMINFPTFFVKDLASYIDFTRFGSALTVKDDDGVDKEKEAAAFAKKQPEILAILEKMIAMPFWNPLEVQYWSQTPYMLGSQAIKFSARPLTSSENKKPEGELGDRFLRNALVNTIKDEPFRFEFVVQVQNDAKKQPIEDPTVEWKESEAPPKRVAIIEIPVQDLSSNKDVDYAEKLTFAAWNSLPAHRPLGSMNRARKSVYEGGAKVRHARNGNTRFEPDTL
ncbi:catalase family protein [Kangiella sp. TOML190]|uniref:catalase family protein n=1 Tax=Kangiella sp. TOML190 TaxID=2931351 RepID=UPI00204252D9|nr:catalase family protein [Kangiella sp. TOML190]